MILCFPKNQFIVGNQTLSRIFDNEKLRNIFLGIPENAGLVRGVGRMRRSRDEERVNRIERRENELLFWDA